MAETVPETLTEEKQEELIINKSSSSYRVHTTAIYYVQPKLNTVPSTFIVLCKVLGFVIMLQ